MVVLFIIIQTAVQPNRLYNKYSALLLLVTLPCTIITTITLEMNISNVFSHINPVKKSAVTIDPGKLTSCGMNLFICWLGHFRGVCRIHFNNTRPNLIAIVQSFHIVI